MLLLVLVGARDGCRPIYQGIRINFPAYYKQIYKIYIWISSWLFFSEILVHSILLAQYFAFANPLFHQHNLQNLLTYCYALTIYIA